ncbi:hypothetical protein M3205_00085 [Cytobacillus firmus]|nr:hypothetical protein [Cytobacillus firmus]
MRITDEVEIEAFPIEVDDNLPVPQLDFETYVAYSIINESFTVMDDYQIFEGNIFRIYSESGYMDFTKEGTIAEDVFPEKQLVHYQIPCLDHIVDIISYEEPKITETKRMDIYEKEHRYRCSFVC